MLDHTFIMLIIFLRAIILYFILLAVMRLMGKRQIGEMQPFEFIITLLISELACIPMADVSIPLSYGIISVLAVFILHQIMSLIERSGNPVKFLISGKPSIVISPDGVDLKELKKNNMGVEDLIEAMRSNGYFSFDDVKYAIFESNGKLSTLENKEKDINGALPYIIINDGKTNNDNLAKFGYSLTELLAGIGEKTDIKQIEILTLDENGRVYLQKKHKKYSIYNLRGAANNE